MHSGFAKPTAGLVLAAVAASLITIMVDGDLCPAARERLGQLASRLDVSETSVVQAANKLTSFTPR